MPRYICGVFVAFIAAGCPGAEICRTCSIRNKPLVNDRRTQVCSTAGSSTRSKTKPSPRMTSCECCTVEIGLHDSLLALNNTSHSFMPVVRVRRPPSCRQPSAETIPSRQVIAGHSRFAVLDWRARGKRDRDLQPPPARPPAHVRPHVRWRAHHRPQWRAKGRQAGRQRYEKTHQTTVYSAQ